MTDRNLPLSELTSWADWARSLDKAAVTPQGEPVLAWALETVAEFYGEEWFARHAAARHLPVMSIYDWPLSSPIAVFYLVERAARIALLPADVRANLMDGPNGIRSSNNPNDFCHLDLLLELIGLAIRDGWSAKAEVETSSGRRPDLVVMRGTMAYTIEVTIQGTDSMSRKVDHQGELLHHQQWAIEMRNDVECTTKLSRLLSAREFESYVISLSGAAETVACTGQPFHLEVDGASADIYPRGLRPAGHIYEGPAIPIDLWPRFATRLREKALQTEGAGATWIRIDEGGGLLHLTPAGQLDLGQQLSLLRLHIIAEMAEYEHVRGVVVSHGAGPDWVPTRPQPTVREPGTGATAYERRLPGGRRRRTFVISMPARSPLLLPPHALIDPGRWYHAEGSWLDWALGQLQQPSLTRLVRGEVARRLII